MKDDDDNAPAASHERLEALLRTYEKVVRQLVEGGWDPAGYRASAELFLGMQEQAVQLATLREAWLAFLISRFEFTHVLWDTRQEPRPVRSLAAAGDRHMTAIQLLLDACAAG